MSPRWFASNAFNSSAADVAGGAAASRALPQVLALDGRQDVDSDGLRLLNGEVRQLGLDIGAVPQGEDWGWPPVRTARSAPAKKRDSGRGDGRENVTDTVVTTKEPIWNVSNGQAEQQCKCHLSPSFYCQTSCKPSKNIFENLGSGQGIFCPINTCHAIDPPIHWKPNKN